MGLFRVGDVIACASLTPAVVMVGDAFLRGRSARDALTGKPVALGKTLELPAKSATLLEID